MPSNSSEYKIPDFILREAMSSGGANADLVDRNGKVMFQADADGWLTAAPAGGIGAGDQPTAPTLAAGVTEKASAPSLSQTARLAQSSTTSEDWSIYQELTAIAEEIQRCRAQVL